MPLFRLQMTGLHIVLVLTLHGLATPPLTVPSPPSLEPPDRLGATATSPTPSEDQVARLAETFAELIEDAVPRDYAKEQDWGRQRRITSGLDFKQRGLRLSVKKRHKYVNHGVWKRYRVKLVDPEQTLAVRLHDLRNLAPGRAGFTLELAARLHLFGQAKIYEHGVHLIALSTEAETDLNLALDCEVGLRVAAESGRPQIYIDPIVRSSHLRLDNFRLRRVGEARGPIIRELSGELEGIIEDELDSNRLTPKLNRAIDKKRDRLAISPLELVGSGWQALESYIPNP